MLTLPELNQSWAIDFMTDTLADGRRFRTVNVIDEGNREGLAIEVSPSLPSVRVIALLEEPLDAMIVDVHIGVPRPDMVDKAQVLAVLPYGKGSVTVVEGGLEICNDNGTDSTLIANACAVVSLDIV